MLVRPASYGQLCSSISRPPRHLPSGQRRGTSIFYGEDTFRIVGTGQKRSYSPASAASLIRHVAMGTDTLKSAKMAILCLKSTQQLQCITFEHRALQAFGDPENMAKALTPLVRALAKGKARAEKAQVPDSLNLPATSFPGNRAQEAKEFDGQLKGLLRQALGVLRD